MPVALAEHARHREAPWSAASARSCARPRASTSCWRSLPADAGHPRRAVSTTSAMPQHCTPAAPRLRTIGARMARARHDRLGEDPDAVAGRPGRNAAAPFAYLEVPRTGVRRRARPRRRHRLAGRQVPHRRRHAGRVPDGARAGRVPGGVRGARCPVQADGRAAPRGPVHRTDEGFEQHGLLNVLVATRVALMGGSVDDVAVPLAQRSADPLVGFVQALGRGHVHRRTGSVPLVRLLRRDRPARRPRRPRTAGGA